MAPRRARTRSEVIVRDQIDRLLQILRIVGEVIRTAGTGDRYLLDFQRNMIHPSLRPPPVMPPFFSETISSTLDLLPSGHYNRARDRLMELHKGIFIGQADGSVLGPFFAVFGIMNPGGERHDVLTRISGWGTLQ